MAHIRKFKTTSGATGVQVCYKRGTEVYKTVHIGSAETPEGVEKLVKKAKRVIEEGEGTMALFDLKRFEK